MRTFLLTAVLSALVLAGCGGDDGASTPAPSDARTEASSAKDRSAGSDAPTADGRDAVAKGEDGQDATAAGASGEDGDGADAAERRRAERDRKRERSASRRSSDRRDSSKRPRAQRTPSTAGGSNLMAVARDFLEGYTRRLSARDTGVCTELFTTRRLEQITQRKGAEAIARCRKDIAASKVRVSLVDVEEAKAAGKGRIDVRAILGTGGNRGLRARFELLDTGDGLRIDAQS